MTGIVWKFINLFRFYPTNHSISDMASVEFVLSSIFLFLVGADYVFGISELYKNKDKLSDALKNNSMTEYHSNYTENEDILKEEARKLLRECGVEVNSGEKNYSDKEKSARGKTRNQNRTKNRNFKENSESNESEDWEEQNDRNNRKNQRRQNFNGKYKKNDNKNNHNNNKRNNQNSKSDDNNDSDDESDDNGGSEEDYDSSDKKYNREYSNKKKKNNDDDEDNNHNNDNNNRRNNRNSNNRNNFFGGSSSYNSNDDNNNNKNDYNTYGSYGNYHSSGYDSNRNRGNYGSYDGNDPNCNSYNRNDNYGSYGYTNNRGNGYDSRGFGSYGRSLSSYLFGNNKKINNNSILRHKRSDTNEEQCVSQCVFGYLEFLDDNRFPSETLVVKWLQEHHQNDMKRIKSLREARRCFGKLSVMDTRDGCDYSKSLSNCLNLDLE